VASNFNAKGLALQRVLPLPLVKKCMPLEPEKCIMLSMREKPFGITQNCIHKVQSCFDFAGKKQSLKRTVTRNSLKMLWLEIKSKATFEVARGVLLQ
jgi:hypothetical protein